MLVTEVIEVPRSVEEAFAYVADFTTVAEWDPGIHSARRVSGDGGIGSVYEVQAEFRGKTMPFTYTVTAYEADRRIVLDGVGEKATSLDTIVFEPSGRPHAGSRTRRNSRSRARCAWWSRSCVGRSAPSRARRSTASRRNSTAHGRIRVEGA